MASARLANQPSEAGPYLVRMTPRRDDAPLRLYCFPPAGMPPAVFLPWADLLPPTIDLYAIQLPGRGNHPSHLSITDPRHLVREIAELFLTHKPEQFALFGHSAGTLLAFETARQLRRIQGPQPSFLGLSGLPPGHHPLQQANILSVVFEGLNSSAELIPRMDEPPGTTTAQQTAYYAPMIADSLLVLHHRHYDETPLDTTAAVYAGESDPLTPAEALTAWNDLLTMPPVQRRYPGGHLYLYDKGPALVGQLVKDISAATRNPTSAPL